MTLPNAVPNAAKHIAEAAWNGIVGMAIADHDGRMIAANPHFCHLLEYTEREIVGKHFREITAPADQATEELEFSLLLSGQIDKYELAKTWISKRQRMIAGNILVQRMENGDIVFAIAQVVESQSPEQIEAIAIMVQTMMKDVLASKGMKIVNAEDDSKQKSTPWYRDMVFLTAVGTVWPVVFFIGWVLFKIAKLIEGSE